MISQANSLVFKGSRFSPLDRQHLTIAVHHLLQNTYYNHQHHVSHSFRSGAATTYTAAAQLTYAYCSMHKQYCIAEKLGGGKFGELILFEHLVKKVWRINRSANRLLIVCTNVDGFSLANDGQFAKFAKLSRYMVV